MLQEPSLHDLLALDAADLLTADAKRSRIGLRADERLAALETGLWASIAAVVAIGRWDLVASLADVSPWILVAALGMLVPTVIINVIVLWLHPVQAVR